MIETKMALLLVLFLIGRYTYLLIKGTLITGEIAPKDITPHIILTNNYIIFRNINKPGYSISIDTFMLIYNRIILKNMDVDIPMHAHGFSITYTKNSITIGCTTFSKKNILDVYKIINVKKLPFLRKIY